MAAARFAALDRPWDAGAQAALGAALMTARRYGDAELAFRAALALDPRASWTWNNLGNAAHRQRRDTEAVGCYRHALALAPDDGRVLTNLAAALVDLDRPDEALEAASRVPIDHPDHAAALCHAAAARMLCGQPEEAARLFARASRLAPGMIAAQCGEGFASLALGDLPRGFALLQNRWRDEAMLAGAANFAETMWLGAEPVAGRRVLLVSEQGAGDTIMFVRFAPLLAARGAHVVLRVPPPLLSLLAPFGYELHADTSPQPDFDLHVAMMSLPLALGTTLSTIPPTPYLSADPSRVAGWRARLGQRRRLRVGVAWSGNPAFRHDRARSMRAEQLLPALAATGAELHVIQTPVREADRAVLQAWPNVTDHSAALTDFAETAALMTALDLVITTCTSVANLAGALGLPGWVLLHTSADHRWLIGRDQSPWYPSLRLWRQRVRGDWAEVVGRVATALAGRLNGA
ncbi:MAG: glycosyltransferase family protein [Rhodospirillales bacterium]|nr:glycosyltransferase family protein [Rhodospirillales bacterium]